MRCTTFLITINAHNYSHMLVKICDKLMCYFNFLQNGLVSIQGQTCYLGFDSKTGADCDTPQEIISDQFEVLYSRCYCFVCTSGKGFWTLMC